MRHWALLFGKARVWVYLLKVGGLVGRTRKNLIAKYASLGHLFQEARVWGCLFSFCGKNEKEPDSKVCAPWATCFRKRGFGVFVQLGGIQKEPDSTVCVTGPR